MATSWENAQISAAMVEAKRWVEIGILDRSWLQLLEAAFRRSTDDTYDPDLRTGEQISVLVFEADQVRVDLIDLLELAHAYGLIEDAASCDHDRIREIGDRIGWFPE